MEKINPLNINIIDPHPNASIVFEKYILDIVENDVIS